MTKWSEKSTFQKILYVFVWIMIIVTIGGVVLGSAAALME